jgi:NAD(P)-dependent dehydrogenase (short-subunit alcohol dehydrogenase family)
VTSPTTGGRAPRAWITGASRGLGRELAVGFAQAGYDVAVTATTAQRLEQVAADLAPCGRDVLLLPADVSDPDQVRACAARIGEAWGGLDTVVAAAGVSPYLKSVTEMSDDEWRGVMQVNVDGTFWTLREAARLMRAAGEPGSLVAVSSVHAVSGGRGLSAYAASKGAVEALVRVLASDLAPHGIRANTLAPGYFSTDMTEDLRGSDKHAQRLLSRVPLARFGEPAELVPAALFLASPQSSFVTGSVLTVDGGWTSL